MNTESQKEFDIWWNKTCRVTPLGEYYHASSKEKSEASWQASREHIIAKLQSEEVVERTAVAIMMSQGNDPSQYASREGAIEPYLEDAKAAIAAVLEGI